MNRQTKHLYVFGPFRFDPDERLLVRGDEPVPLPPKLTETLFVLVQSAGHLVDKDELMTRVWPDAFVEDGNLNKNISVLRKTLGQWDGGREYIETVPKRGYRFAPIVTQRAKEATDSVPAEGVTGITVPPVADKAGVIRGAFPISAKTRWIWFIALTRNWKRMALLTAGLMILGGLGYRAFKSSRSKIPDLQRMTITRLTDTGQVAEVAISPDGRYVAYERLGGEEVSVWLQQVTTHAEVQILPPGGHYIRGLTFSPDGNQLYFVGTDKDDPFLHYLYMMPALGGSARRVVTDADTPVSFSPDGREFVFTRGDPTRTVVEVRVAEADGSNERLLATMQDSSSDNHAAAGATWSPDGRTICVPLRRKQKPGVLEMVSVADGSAHEFYTSSWYVGRALWQPQGDALVVELEDHTGKGQLWMIPYPHGEPRRLTNDLFYYGIETDMTKDGKTVASTAIAQTSNVWSVPARNLSSAQQITTGNLAMVEVAGLADGRVLSVSTDHQAWIMDADGSHRAHFGNALNVHAITACGKFVVFLSSQAGTSTDTLIRMDADGSNPIALASGILGNGPSCSPDGAFVYYLNLQQPRKIARVPIEGGAPVDIGKPLGEASFGLVNVSRDGKFLAYSFDEGIEEPLTRLAVIPVTGGLPIKLIKGLAGLVRWSPDGTGLNYLETRNQVTNVWEQPVSSGAPKQLTHFTSERIFNFNWSADGKHLLVTRGNMNSDVVLISNFR